MARKYQINAGLYAPQEMQWIKYESTEFYLRYQGVDTKFRTQKECINSALILNLAAGKVVATKVKKLIYRKLSPSGEVLFEDIQEFESVAPFEVWLKFGYAP